MSDLRNLPKIDALASHELLAAFPEKVRSEAARRAVGMAREALKSGAAVDLDGLPSEAQWVAVEMSRPSVRQAINMSGVVLHTGLGRARLAAEAVAAMLETATHHATVEFDLRNGKRGDRQEHVRDLLKALTGAEDALVVNNAASGVVLSLSALCRDRDVVLSRGQMVEIGGSFRMPDIVRESGCRLVEVGCTNKTRISDYEAAMGEEPGAILRCHPSNFKIIGFTEQPSAAELAGLARGRGWRMIDDIGSGCLLDTTRFGLPKEETLQESVAAGADVVVASGDKLLGGPQAGLVLGKADAISRIKRHPLARAVRVDKLTLSALEATLRLYRDERSLEIPTWRYIARPLAQVRSMAKSLAKAAGAGAVLEEGLTEIGGGSAPGSGVPTYRVGLSADNPDALLAMLREAVVPVVGRIEDGRVWLDPRTIDRDELALAVSVLGAMSRG